MERPAVPFRLRELIDGIALKAQRVLALRPVQFVDGRHLAHLGGACDGQRRGVLFDHGRLAQPAEAALHRRVGHDDPFTGEVRALREGGGREKDGESERHDCVHTFISSSVNGGWLDGREWYPKQSRDFRQLSGRRSGTFG